MKLPLLILMLGLSVAIGSAQAQGPKDRPAPPRPQAAAQASEKADAEDEHEAREPKPDERARLSPEEAAEALALISRLKPELGDELRELQEKDPQRFHAELHNRFPRYRWLLRLKRYDPEMFELRIQDIEHYRRSRELAEQVRDARKEGKADAEQAARKKLDEVVAEHFAVRQQIREAELARLERRLEELREQLAERSENREQFLADHAESLIAGNEHNPRDRD